MADIIKLLKQKNLKLITAESCTAGKLGSAFASMEGASDAYEGGFITYTEGAKIQLLGIAPDIIKKHGAVSKEAAAAMAEGAVSRSGAGVAISITGVAGPTSTGGKPVGLVFIGIHYNGKTKVTRHNFSGDCDAVKNDAVSSAIEEAACLLKNT